MKKVVILLLALLLTAAGCAGTGEKEVAYVRISAAEAQTLMQDGAPYVLVDVRTAAEFQEGHIAGAVLLPDNDIAEKAAEVLPEKDARILLYCRSGRRSEAAAKALLAMGYTHVLDFGGIIDWPFEIER